jgi:flagellar protein FlaG
MGVEEMGMVEQVNVSASSSVPSTTNRSIGRHEEAVRAQAANKKEPSVAPDKPKIAMSQVAVEAAQEKQQSIDSLHQTASELREAISTLNAALEKTPTKAIITKDEDLNRFIVRIADQKSGEVVRESPSEALLKFARNLQELKGLIFDASL